MRVCTSCGTAMDLDDIFCPMCGTKYEERNADICEKCGAELEEDASFCMICGAPVKMRKALADAYMQPAASASAGRGPKPAGRSSAPSRTGKNLKAAAVAAGAVYAGGSAVPYSVPGRLTGEVDDAAAAEKTSFYIVDFIKSLIKSHRVPVIIYLILNILVIWGVFFLLFGGQSLLYSFLGAMVCYLISVTIALSPVGETMLRWQTGCGKIGRQEIVDKIEPLYQEARNRAVVEARREGLSIPENIELFMNDDEYANAFATGRRTICFTKGLLDIPEDQIIATLCHEFGHIAHHDTDSILLITVGNMIVTFIMSAIRICTIIGGFIMNFIMLMIGGEEGLFGSLIFTLSQIITVKLIEFLMFVWTLLGKLLVMKTSRAEEFKADEFAFRCGYGNSLCALLDWLQAGSQKETGLFATLMSSHPDSDLRIGALQELGATYRASF